MSLEYVTFRFLPAGRGIAAPVAPTAFGQNQEQFCV